MNLLTYALCAPAMLLMLLTVVALLNNLNREQWAPRWHVRRAALTIAGTGDMMLLASPFATWTPHWSTIAFLMLFWGVAGALMTHPGMPPWHELTGFVRSKLPKRQATADLRQRIR